MYAHRVEPAQHGDDPEVDEGQRGDEQGRLQKRGEPALPGCAPQPPCNAHEPEHGRRQEALLHDRGGAERDEPEGARGGARTLEPCLEQDQTSRDQHDPVDGVRGHEGEDVEVDQYCPRGAEHVRQAPRGGRTAARCSGAWLGAKLHPMVTHGWGRARFISIGAQRAPSRPIMG